MISFEYEKIDVESIMIKIGPKNYKKFDRYMYIAMHFDHQVLSKLDLSEIELLNPSLSLVNALR